MIDFEKALIASIIRFGYPSFVSANIKGLSEPAKMVIDFIGEHYRLYDKEPSFDVLKLKTDIDFSQQPNEHPMFWGKEISKKNAFLYLRDTINNANSILSSDPIGCRDLLVESLLKMDDNQGDQNNLWNVFDKTSMLHTIDSIGNRTGIPTFHPTLTGRTGGWEPQDLIIIAGRPASGKSFVLLQNCLAAWVAGFRTMLITTEMSRRAMQLRLASLYFKLSYGALKNNSLATMHRMFLEQKLDEIEKSGIVDVFAMMGDTMDVTIENIEKQIRIYKPQFVAIDGAYLVKSSDLKAKDRYQRIAEIFDSFKSIAKRNNVAIAVTTQINRPPSKKGGESAKYGIERLAFSDNVGMVSDYAFLLHKEPEDRDANILEIEIGKLRESNNYDDFWINWDLHKHNFDEISKEEVDKRRLAVSSDKKDDKKEPKKSTPIASKSNQPQDKWRGILDEE